MMKLNTIAMLLNCPSNLEATIQDVCIDSRQVKPGSLFVALRGERYDGHDFLIEAKAKGAVAAICNQANPTLDLPQLEVPNSIEALAQIAIYHRNSIACPTIALTGSNGKTTVKEMIASILPKPAYATRGNLNNHLGAPLSVLQLESQHRYAVFELGASHQGEIAHTVNIVKPNVVLINNIAPAHIGEFGSIEGVARAKGEIIKGVSFKGTVVLNEDDAYAHFWDEQLGDKQVLRFSLKKGVDFYTRDLFLDHQGFPSFELISPLGSIKIKLQVPGEHTVRNALAAAGCCYAIGIGLEDIAQGLEKFQGVAGRLTFLPGKNQSLIIDDSYNANLNSVLAAIDVLSQCEGQRILVLGDMGELGTWTQQHHEKVGYEALRHGIDCLMTCGIYTIHATKAFGQAATHYNTQEDLARDLLEKLQAGTTVLVKGSRSSAMEKIVYQLLN